MHIHFQIKNEHAVLEELEYSRDDMIQRIDYL